MAPDQRTLGRFLTSVGDEVDLRKFGLVMLAKGSYSTYLLPDTKVGITRRDTIAVSHFLAKCPDFVEVRARDNSAIYWVQRDMIKAFLKHSDDAAILFTDNIIAVLYGVKAVVAKQHLGWADMPDETEATPAGTGRGNTSAS